MPLPLPSAPWQLAQTMSYIFCAVSRPLPVAWRRGPDSGCAFGEPLDGGGGSWFLLQAAASAMTRALVAIQRQARPSDPRRIGGAGVGAGRAHARSAARSGLVARDERA